MVFGEVISGMAVVQKIEMVDTMGGNNRPVKMQSVLISNCGVLQYPTGVKVPPTTSTMGKDKTVDAPTANKKGT